jgi:membrane-associated protease RseP (regulator of RpoE activity)
MNRLIGAVALSLTATAILHAQRSMQGGFSNPYNTCQTVILGVHGSTDGTVSFVRQLDPLSPEALAGLRAGDTIVAMNGIALGRPRPAGSPTAWRYAPGDTNVYEVRGPTGPRRITFVVGEWHDVPADSTATSPDGRPTKRLCRPPVSPR